MKISNLLLSSSILTQSIVSAKNIVDLKADFKDLEKRDDDSSNIKEPVHYPPLGGYGLPVIDKRESYPKNVVDLSSDLVKRDPEPEAKNVVDLSQGFKNLDKRDAKNLFDFEANFIEREGKKVVDLSSLDFSMMEKREGKNILSIKLKDETIVILPKFNNVDIQQLLINTDALADDQKRQVFKIITLSHPELLPTPLTGESPRMGPTLLTTLLTQHSTISHYSYMIRDNLAISHQFDNANSFYIVLAPSDNSIEALPKLPWYYPNSVDGKTMTESQKERIMRDNINDFIGKHVIEVDGKDGLDSFHDKVYATVDGLRVKIGKIDEFGKYKIFVLTDEVNVKYQVDVNDAWKCENGIVLELNGVLSLPKSS